MNPRRSRTPLPQSAARPHPRAWLWPAATAAAVIVLAAGLFAFVNRPVREGPLSLAPAGVPRGVTATGEPTLGSPQARVVMDEFGDFQCPYCGGFVRDTEPRIIAAYVRSGKVRIVWHSVAFIGPESVLAARAAWCAQERGKFWEYFAVLYEHQDGENTGTFNPARLERWAGDLGLDRAAFATCLASPRSLAGPLAGTREAQNAGIHETPAFIVNGRTATGALTFDELSALIAQALSAR